jgi:hypothetical protein
MAEDRGGAGRPGTGEPDAGKELSSEALEMIAERFIKLLYAMMNDEKTVSELVAQTGGL